MTLVSIAFSKRLLPKNAMYVPSPEKKNIIIINGTENRPIITSWVCQQNDIFENEKNLNISDFGASSHIYRWKSISHLILYKNFRHAISLAPMLLISIHNAKRAKNDKWNEMKNKSSDTGTKAHRNEQQQKYLHYVTRTKLNWDVKVIRLCLFRCECKNWKSFFMFKMKRKRTYIYIYIGRSVGHSWFQLHLLNLVLLVAEIYENRAA